MSEMVFFLFLNFLLYESKIVRGPPFFFFCGINDVDELIELKKAFERR